MLLRCRKTCVVLYLSSFHMRKCRQTFNIGELKITFDEGRSLVRRLPLYVKNINIFFHSDMQTNKIIFVIRFYAKEDRKCLQSHESPHLKTASSRKIVLHLNKFIHYSANQSSLFHVFKMNFSSRQEIMGLI